MDVRPACQRNRAQPVWREKLAFEGDRAGLMPACGLERHRVQVLKQQFWQKADSVAFTTCRVVPTSQASQVEFNPSEQVWEVRLASNPGVVAFSHVSRATCVAWEREALQN